MKTPWKEYQKQIADNDYYYARSCIRQNFFPGSEAAFLNILRNDLGQDIHEDPRHTSCTGIGYHTDIVPLETIMTVVARQFSLMTESGLREFRPVVHHVVRHLFRSARNVARLPGTGRRPATTFIKLPAANSKAEKPGAHVRRDFPPPRRDRRESQTQIGQRRNRKTAARRRTHRLPLCEDFPEGRYRRIGIPVRAGRND